MARCLNAVAANVEAWKREEVSVWQLNNVIYKYHNVAARELYKAYSLSDPLFTTAFGIANGVISIGDVDESCRNLISNLVVTLFQRHHQKIGARKYNGL